MAAGGAEATPTDILFQDENVCILRPDSERGIVLFSLASSDKVCEEGLLSYSELSKRHPEIGLKKRKPFGAHNLDHDELIYFRAPYTQDASSFESSYKGQTPESIVNKEDSGRSIVLLRVDPDKSNVFFSEARTGTGGAPFESYKQTLTQYIQSPISERGPRGDYMMTMRNLRGKVKYEEDWEVVVKLPHIPPEWFVKCIFNGKELWNRWAPPAENVKPEIQITEPFILEGLDTNLKSFTELLKEKISYIENIRIHRYDFDAPNVRRVYIKTNKEKNTFHFEIFFKIDLSTLIILQESHQGDVAEHIDISQSEMDKIYDLVDIFLETMKTKYIEWKEKEATKEAGGEAEGGEAEGGEGGAAAGGASGGGRRRKTKSKQSKKSKKSKHATPRRHTTKRRQRSR